MLAAEIIRDQDVDVLALFFETPFFDSSRARQSAGHMALPLRIVDITQRHLEVVKKPVHGYGGNMNPCIDCHALMIRIAGELMPQEQADFLITGEVLGQRPLSQNRKALAMVAEESGVADLLIRPLSAKHLSPTRPERRGWVKRERLEGFQGRTRKPQMELAEKLNITEYPSPAGGCLLTEKVFSRRLKDLLSADSHPGLPGIELLKLGRHFRINSRAKLVVGRNKRENERILKCTSAGDVVLSTALVPGPVVLVSGSPEDADIEKAAAVTAAYSDASDGEETQIKVAGPGGERILPTKALPKEEFAGFMI